MKFWEPLLGLFYNSWAIICVASIAVSSLLYLKSLKNWFISNNISGILNVLRVIFSLAATVAVVISAVTFIFYTKVPNLLGISLSEARRYLRDCNLGDGYLPNTKYDSMAVQAEVIYQSIEEGEIVLKETIVYLDYYQDENECGAGEGGGNTDESKEEDSVGSNQEDSFGGQTKTPDNNLVFSDSDEKGVSVPDVVGMEQDDAIMALYMSGLQFQVYLNSADDFDCDTYYVTDQSYKYGDNVNVGTVVKLELSSDLPETIHRKNFEYEQDDSSVKSTTELNGFYIYSHSVTYASFYDAATSQVSSPDYLTEKLCQVDFTITGADDAVLSIYMEGQEVGFCFDNNLGKSEIFINKGTYMVSANYGNYTKTVYVDIVSSGEYIIHF